MSDGTPPTSGEARRSHLGQTGKMVQADRCVYRKLVGAPSASAVCQKYRRERAMTQADAGVLLYVLRR